MTNVAALFDQLKDQFKADKAKSDKAVMAFELSGDGGGTYWLKVDNGTLDVGQGEPPAAADLTLKATAGDFVAIMSKQMNPMTAFMSGKVKAVGNMGLAMKLMGWFGLS
jgi:putative sterol carrier protein